MRFLNKTQLLNLIENTLKDVKKNNEYKDLNFIDNIFTEKKIISDVKRIIKGQIVENIEKNYLNRVPKFSFEHLYNYLRCENVLSKYETIAEKMLYPSINFVLENEDKIVEEYGFENNQMPTISSETIDNLKKDLANILDKSLYHKDIHDKFKVDYGDGYFNIDRTFEYYKTSKNLSEDIDERDMIGNEDYVDFQSFIQVKFQMINEVVTFYFFKGYDTYNKFKPISEKYTDVTACANAIVNIALESINEMSKTLGRKISESYPEKNDSFLSKLLKNKQNILNKLNFIRDGFAANNLFKIFLNEDEPILKIVKSNKPFCEIHFSFGESTDRFVYYVVMDGYNDKHDSFESRQKQITYYDGVESLIKGFEKIFKENQ